MAKVVHCWDRKLLRYNAVCRRCGRYPSTRCSACATEEGREQLVVHMMKFATAMDNRKPWQF